ncbi:3',5'-cyclic-nucleotide phosphodiesterase [Malassezia vespertilionis]|uniref:3',5'-cyclic-nucleotide phosphodiesterase n=1 Tax=Malassezia vespertilionis TaxID=2020962 RepID=UPI0024B1E4DF|nr:3',5'-cyclic-nucleotide phosphodiesterase [Malassezia vespertilionis]WFD05341.1 3',5'-cyclic-nucleotide phosphodiesterase [Malassezia vespertilionis]
MADAPQAPAFTFVCLGVSGGPLETNCSGYIMKPGDQPWDKGATLVEGGSWLGALVRILEDPDNTAFADAPFPPGISAESRAEMLNAWVSQVLISHGHLDHTLGLILASASQRSQRSIYGFKDTLDSLLGVFNGRIWPRLASYNASDPLAFYHLRPYVHIATDRSMDVGIPLLLHPGISVVPYAISHGMSILEEGADAHSQFDMPVPDACSLGPIAHCVSTAFMLTNCRLDRDVLVRCNISLTQFLGDVEPDSIGGMHLNKMLWEKIAPRVAAKKMTTMFIECSFDSQLPDSLLFGHLTPLHLYAELRSLAMCVCQARNAAHPTRTHELDQSLADLTCVITHIKAMHLPCVLPSTVNVGMPENMPKEMGKPVDVCNNCSHALPIPLPEIIERELAELEAKERLGVKFIIAKQGLRIGSYTRSAHARMLNL